MRGRRKRKRVVGGRETVAQRQEMVSGTLALPIITAVAI